MLVAVGPDDAGEATPAEADHGAQGLAHGTFPSSGLRKELTPIGEDVQYGDEKSHCASGRTAKVFLAVRKKRSFRAIFLVREETRLSRSMETPKEERMRSRRMEIWRGARAFLSTS